MYVIFKQVRKLCKTQDVTFYLFLNQISQTLKNEVRYQKRLNAILD